MAKNRAVILLILSLIISAMAVWAAVQWVNRQVEKRTTVHTIKLVVASTNINAGSHLGPELLRTVDWPAGSAVTGSFSDPQPLLNRVTNVNISAGEPVL